MLPRQTPVYPSSILRRSPAAMCSNRLHRGGAATERPAFALIVALSLMTFLLLLMLLMSTLLMVETQHSATMADRNLARQNALYGAMEALGELQHYAGPDQRATARAEIFTDPDSVDADPNDSTGLYGSINEPFWTGVWITDASEFASADQHGAIGPIKEGITGNPGGAARWLVSNPDRSNPLNPLAHERNSDHVPLLLAFPDDPDDPRNIHLPLADITGANNAVVGRYAWWVSDEGLKASLTLDNAWAQSTDLGDRHIAALTASRYAPEFIRSGDTDFDLWPLTSLPTPYESQIARSGALGDFELLLDKAGASTAVLRSYLHDLTPMAMSVQADMRAGGLKRNLTAAFSDNTAFDVLTASPGSPSHDPALSHGGELIFGRRDQTTAFSPLGSSAQTYTTPRDPGGPPWEQLRSFYNLAGAAGSGGGAIAPRGQRNNQMGVNPIITHFQMHFHVLMLEDTPSEGPPEYVLRLVAFPALILWNPYNVELAPEDYTVYYGRNLHLFYYWVAKINYNHDDNGTIRNEVFESGILEGTPRAHQPYRFDFTTGFAPGESKLFVPELPQPRQSWLANPSNELVDGTGQMHGGYIYTDYNERFIPKGNMVGDIKLEIYGGVTGHGGHPHPRIGQNSVVLHLRNNLTSPQNHTFNVPPLQTIGGFSDWRHELDNYSWDIPSQGGSYLNGFPQYEDWREKSWREFDPAVGLAGSFVPVRGVYLHHRWMRNAFDPAYGGFGGTPPWDPVFAYLAHLNPRSVRSWRTPVEDRQQHVDSRFNPMYYSGIEFGNAMTSATVTAWETINEKMAGLPVPVGYTDDVDVSMITRSTLFDLPRGPEYFQSIASLQHAYLSPPEPPSGDNSYYVTSDFNTDSSYPAFPVGNSIAPLAVQLDRRAQHEWIGTYNSTLYDWSYLLNDYLWDSYFFAPYDATRERLLNPRLVRLPEADPSKLETLGGAASALMVQGSFNVNSTSVAAWRALLSGLVGAEVTRASGGSTTYETRSPYLRNTLPLEGNADTAIISDPETYSGYRTLDADQIDSLAREIVRQVKKRGPFISMAHFVNRVIDAPAFRSTREADNLSGRERAIGALQAALETSTVNANYNDPNYVIDETVSSRIEQFEALTALGPKAFGQAGYVTQADILSRIGSVLTARSDTFKIRSYGEVVNPVTGRAQARAWCEMVVQRTPEELPGMDQRRFRVVSFRWLNENEL